MNNKAYILSIDDEELNQEIICDLLEDKYDITVLSSGKECLKSVAENTPDLILLDVNMPVMNGIVVCKKLRSLKNSKDIPIIFVSALASEREMKIGIDAGANDYVTKPFEEDDLKERIDVLIK